MELTRKYFQKMMDKFTGNCELPSKKIEEMTNKLAVAGKSIRKSLAAFRKRIEKRIYSIYCKSVNSANVKKANSFIIFVSNLKHFLKLNSDLLEGCVELYAELFDHVDGFTQGGLGLSKANWKADWLGKRILLRSTSPDWTSIMRG